jgi:hypothetical protein
MPDPRRPLLIVPIRDRRQHRRILTIRNCAISMLALAVIFATISIVNGMRRGPSAEYGRLFGNQVSTPNEGVTRKVDVIREAPVSDQRNADPMLVAPAAREQVLMANTNAPGPVTTVTTIAPQPAKPTPPANAHGTSIVGDGTGITVVKAPATSTAPRAVLQGGIFKQQ